MPRDDRPPEQLTKAELRARILWRARKMLRECNQAISDGEWWAKNRPECEPIDFEDFRVLRAIAITTLKQFGETP